MSSERLRDPYLKLEDRERLDAELRYELISHWLDPNATVVDFGARYGYGHKFLLDRNVRIVAVDLNKKILEQSMKNDKVSIVNMTIDDFLNNAIATNQKFDAAILAEVIEHVDLWKWHNLLSRILQIAQKILITTPYDQDQIKYVKHNLDRHYRACEPSEPDIHKVFNINPELFRVLGFNVIRYMPVRYPTPRMPNDNLISYYKRHLQFLYRKWHKKYWLIEIGKKQ